MQELQQEEIDAVNGGFMVTAIVVIAVVAAVGVGIYIGYREAAHSAK